MQATVYPCRQGYKRFLNVYLVRRPGAKAVRVIVRPFPRIQRQVDDTELAELAATEGAKRGWRTVVVAPDEHFCDIAQLFNMAQYGEGLAGAHKGAFLCVVGRTKLPGSLVFGEDVFFHTCSSRLRGLDSWGTCTGRYRSDALNNSNRPQA